MKLSEMRQQEEQKTSALVLRVLEGEVVEVKNFTRLPEEDDDEEEEDDDDDEEVGLREELDLALSMLSDANKMIEAVVRLGEHGRVRFQLHKELIDRASEINAFLDQYDFSEVSEESKTMDDETAAILDMQTMRWRT